MTSEFNNNVKWANDTLYSRDIHGNILSWNIRVEQDVINIDSYNIVRVYGRIDGKQQSTYTNITKGKNIGKKNATTPKQQAIKEAKAIVKEKAKQGYRSCNELGIVALDKNNNVVYRWQLEERNNYNEILQLAIPKEKLDANNFSKPMLATKYKGKAEMPALLQPKINGVRCFVSMRKNEQKDLFNDTEYEVILTSREGLVLDVPHIKEAFRELYKHHIEIGDDISSVVFDGELYVFNSLVTDIAGAARNPKNPINKHFVYVCFDLAIPELSNKDRNEERNRIFDNFATLNIFGCDKINIINLDSIYTTEQNDVVEYTEMFIKMGYEGCIIRQINAEYQFGKRRVTMQKSKKFFDKEYKLIDIIPTEKEVDSVGRSTCLFVCETETGEPFNVTPYGYSKSQKADILINKYIHIGKDITVKYYETTKTGKPFHANGHIREYK